jgi:phosphocarrier protein HPr
MIKKQYNLKSSTGFARPANILVRVSNKHVSNLFIEYEGISIKLNYTAESLTGVMSLGIGPGAPFAIRAEGIDEHQALQSIEDYFRKMELIN